MKDRLILEFPEFISAAKVAEIKEVMRANAELGGGNSYNREGDTISITGSASRSAALKELDTYLVSIFSKLAELSAIVFKPPYATADSGYEYHIYPPGSVCKKHADYEIMLGGSQYTPNEYRKISLVRYATAVIYLTTNKGGELVFPDIGVRVRPEVGKAVVFPPYASYEHYSEKAEEDREIIMTWFVYNNVNASFI